jgi:hypothetical protein
MTNTKRQYPCSHILKAERENKQISNVSGGGKGLKPTAQEDWGMELRGSGLA